MALRDQPYLPLYVQDYLTDEKLNMCSAAAQGIYIKLLCIMHKSKEYGVIELKANFKQNKSKVENFAEMLCRLITFQPSEIKNALLELLEENVLYIEGEKLCQKRMIKDGELSEKRAKSGSTGGKKGRDSGMKRFYNEDGYLYLLCDKDDDRAFKIGISKEPEKRIYGIKRKENRPNLEFRRRWKVNNMGKTEQAVLDFFEEIRDGEWIFGSYDIQEIENQINKIIFSLSKTKAKPENENEYENEDEYEIIKGGAGGKTEKTNFSRIIEMYNSTCTHMPTVQTVSDERKKAIRARVKQYGEETIQKVFELAAQSNFLNGVNDTGFTATFDWIMGPKNFVKVLEGNYCNRPVKNGAKASKLDELASVVERVAHQFNNQ